MGFMRDQASRLIREKWANPNLLAEELYAMFTSDDPVNIDSPVTITSPTTSNDAPLTLRNFGNTDNIIDIVQSNPPINFPPLPPLPDIPPLPPLEFPPGTITFTTIYVDGSGQTSTTDRGADPTPTPPKRGDGKPISSAGGGGFPCKVISGGPGAIYQCDIYPDGLGAAPTRVSVTQLQIDPTATIPPNNWTIAVKAGDFYYMQIPVWFSGI